MTCETKGHSALAIIEYAIPITAYNNQHSHNYQAFIHMYSLHMQLAIALCRMQSLQAVQKMYCLTLCVMEWNRQVFNVTCR